MAGDEDTIRWDGIARFEVENIANSDVVDGYHERFARSNYLDLTVIFLFSLSAQGLESGDCTYPLVEFDELSLFLPVIGSTNSHHNNDGDTDRHSFDPVDA